MHQNMHQTLQTRKMQGIFKGRSTDNLFNLDGLFMVPGGGVEPPRAEARRILSLILGVLQGVAPERIKLQQA